MAATAATITSGMDGTLAASSNGRTVTITRQGDGAVTNAAVAVVLSIPSVTNQKFEGASGAWVALMTTLNDGTTKIDDAAASGGALPAEVTFTPSIFNGVTPTVAPATLVAGAEGASALSFTTGNPIPNDGKIIFEVPNTFETVSSSLTVASSSNLGGGFVVTVTGTSTTYAATLKTAGGPWTITIERQGDGAIVAANTVVAFTLSNVINQQHEGASGVFPLFKTTLSDGTTSIDESSAEADSYGSVPPSVTFTPSGFKSIIPTVVPQSLVVGETHPVDFTFTTQNPIPVDGKIIVEVPATFTAIADSITVGTLANIDGGLTVTSTGTATTYASTLKTAGGPWVVTISRDGDGTTVPKDTVVTFTLTDFTNQQFEGASGTFPLLKTTLSDGTTAIDESSAEGDAYGTVGPSVTFTPSGWSNVAPTITPQSLIAGATTDIDVTFTTQNPVPADGKIIFEFPSTFTDVAGSAVSALGNIDGTFAVTQTGTATVYASTLKTTGGSWVVTITRQGDGTTVPSGTAVSFTLSNVINQQHEGASGVFPLFKTTLSDGTTSIDESSAEADSYGTVGPSVTFTPSLFSSATPSAIPVSLIAGDTTGLRISFVAQNPIPADGVIWIEIPATFTNVSATAVVNNAGIDGTYTISQTGTKSTFTKTLKNVGGPWVVKLERNNDGTTVPTTTTVDITLDSVTTMQFEGSSGIYPLLKTTLTDGTTAIDEASPEANSLGTEPPSVTIVPATFLSINARPNYLVADLNSTFSFEVGLKNPLPVGAVLELILPNTFQFVGPGVINTTIDGGISWSITNTWVLRIVRDGSGTVIPSGTLVSFDMDKVINRVNIGATGDYNIVTYLADGVTRIDTRVSPSIYIDKQVTNVGVSFGDTTVAVTDQLKQWFFHGYGMNQNDEIKWIGNFATRDDHCNTSTHYSTSQGITMEASGTADDVVNFDVYFAGVNSESEGGLKLCYKFANNTDPKDNSTPWKLYEGMTVQVRQLYGAKKEASQIQGHPRVAVAHRQKTIKLDGYGMLNDDQVRFITGGTNCSKLNANFVNYRDEEWWEAEGQKGGGYITTESMLNTQCETRFYSPPWNSPAYGTLWEKNITWSTWQEFWVKYPECLDAHNKNPSMSSAPTVEGALRYTVPAGFPKGLFEKLHNTSLFPTCSGNTMRCDSVHCVGHLFGEATAKEHECNCAAGLASCSALNIFVRDHNLDTWAKQWFPEWEAVPTSAPSTSPTDAPTYTPTDAPTDVPTSAPIDAP